MTNNGRNLPAQSFGEMVESGQQDKRRSKIYREQSAEFVNEQLSALINKTALELKDAATSEPVSLRDTNEVKRRTMLYLRACEEAGIPEADRRVLIIHDNEELRRKLVEWRAEGVDGIFVFCDMEAWNLTSTLQDMGVRVPEEIAVVGYDNIQGRILFPMPLCTIDPSIDEMIQQALTLLRRRIHRDEAPPQTIKVAASIVCRGSCGCAQHRKA